MNFPFAFPHLAYAMQQQQGQQEPAPSRGAAAYLGGDQRTQDLLGQIRANPGMTVTGTNVPQHSWSGMQFNMAPRTPAAPSTPAPAPAPTGVDQYKVPGAPYFASYGPHNPHPPEGNLYQYAQPVQGLFSPGGNQIVRLPTDAMGHYDPITGKWIGYDFNPGDDGE